MYGIDTYKKTYLRTLPPTRIDFELKMLKKIFVIEKKLQKSINEANIDEVVSEIYNMGISNEHKKLLLLSVLNYKSWYSDNFTPEDNSRSLNKFHEMSLEIDHIKNTSVSSPHYLNKFLACIFPPIKDNTSDNIYRCACWLIYMGIENEDIYNISISDIDLKNRVVNYKGKSIEIYNESIDVFKSCVQSKSFNVMSGSRNNRLVSMPRKEGDKLLRNTNLNSNDENYNFMKVYKDVLSQKIKKSGTSKDLSAWDIRVSGIFYRIARAELDLGIEPDFSCFSKSKRTKYRYLYELWRIAGAF